jgi:alanyl aminopeptidase
MRPVAALLVLTSLGLAQESEAPKLRLPGGVTRPLKYTLDLTLIPENDRFSGSVEIDVELIKPTRVIWLNANNLKIDSAVYRSGKREWKAGARAANKDFLSLTLPEAAPVGKGVMRIVYSGEMNRRGSGAIFQVREGDHWYIYTQMEPTDARQSFPCFDEPAYKTPWKVTLHVKREHVAVANTPTVSETEEANGMKRVVFSESKPLPSYLVAFAVGPFDIVDAGKAGRNHTPLRVITPRGLAAHARYAAEVIGPALERLENYFGIPYPYEKLDSVAIPLTFGFSAMENAGMITYASSAILADPERDSILRQRRFATIAVHEMGHQWFGNLVTLAWWDDVWLNEAFASWVESRILAEWKPEWNRRVADQTPRLAAMNADRLVSARKIRQPIESNNDISNAFDIITYQKGSAVIRMFESWAGEENFRKGVQRYLKQHAWKTATSGDFLDAVSSVGPPGLARAFSTFLQQGGVPLVTVTLRCDGAPSLELKQERSLPVGSAGSRNETWQIPVCVRYGAGGETRRQCTLLTAAQQTMRLESKSCPSWVIGNAEGSGYYHTRYDVKLLGATLADGAKQLSPAELRATLGDVQALVDAGTMPAGAGLALAAPFAGHPMREVVLTATAIMRDVRQNLVPDELLPNYARFIAKAYGERARRLGWQSKPGDDTETRLIRAGVLQMAASDGRDETLRSEARTLAERWLTDRSGVEPDMVNAVLATAARAGDQTLFDRFVAAFAATQDRDERQRILQSLIGFPGVDLTQARLDLLLRPDFDLRESGPLLVAGVETRAARSLPFRFLQANWDAVVKKMPTGGGVDFGARLPRTGGGFCDEKGYAEVEGYFRGRIENFVGGPRNLASTLEGIRLCAALRSVQEESVVEFLKGY